MTNRAQIHEFYKVRKLETKFQSSVFNIYDLLGLLKLAINEKFQLNISKFMPPGQKNTGAWSVNTTINHYSYKI